MGTVDRSNDFRPDLDLPENCYAVRPSDYRGSGYDRGHLIPSGDRTDSEFDNSSTFLMTNIVPQSPSNNREIWRELEEYSRQLTLEGNKLYIVAGGYGIAKKIANSQVVVPEYVWKVILIIEPISEAMDTIAVLMPNSEQVRNTDWRDYIVSVDLIEQQTGYDFFAKVPRRVQKEIEQAYYQQLHIDN